VTVIVALPGAANEQRYRCGLAQCEAPRCNRLKGGSHARRSESVGPQGESDVAISDSARLRSTAPGAVRGDSSDRRAPVRGAAAITGPSLPG
jgi:hypothetical protein